MRSLDRVFVQSSRLDSNAIASFVEALWRLQKRARGFETSLGICSREFQNTTSDVCFLCKKLLKLRTLISDAEVE